MFDKARANLLNPRLTLNIRLMGYVIINDSHVMTADEAKKREMEAFVYLSSEKKSLKNHQLKKFFFGREKSIFHNYFPLIDKSKY